MHGAVWTVLAALVELGARLGLVMYILLRREPRDSVKVAWIAVILAVPLLGLVGYLLLGEARLGRRRIRRHREVVERIASAASRHSDPTTIASDEIPRHYRQLAMLAESVGGFPPTRGNELDLLSDTEAFFDTLVADIDGAESHCNLLFYIYLDDAGGRRVAEALGKASGRGIACRLLVDAVGSKGFLRSALRRELEAAGVQVVAALPVHPLRMLLARIDIRNHRKIAVIDGVIGWVGSQNIAEASFAPKPKFAPWIDAMVRARGPIVRDLQTLFIEDWYLDTGEPLEELLAIIPAPASDGVAAQIMGSGPNSLNQALRQLKLSAIHLAREEVVLTTPYFVPDDATAFALRSAPGRGVETILIVPARNDSPLVAAASRSQYDPLLEEGVQIHEYGGGLLHAKTMSVDRDLALIGTANFDRRSFDLNFEVSLVVYDSDFASVLRFLQTSYLDRSHPVDASRWIRRPWPVRLWENAAGLLSPLL